MVIFHCKPLPEGTSRTWILSNLERSGEINTFQKHLTHPSGVPVQVTRPMAGFFGIGATVRSNIWDGMLRCVFNDAGCRKLNGKRTEEWNLWNGEVITFRLLEIGRDWLDTSKKGLSQYVYIYMYIYIILYILLYFNITHIGLLVSKRVWIMYWLNVSLSIHCSVGLAKSQDVPIVIVADSSAFTRGQSQEMS